MTGGSLTVIGGESAIGAAAYGPGGPITISGGSVVAKGADMVLGGRLLGTPPTVVVSGGSLTAGPIDPAATGVMAAAIGGGARGGSLPVGAGATVSLDAKDEAFFGAHGIEDLTVASTLTLANGHLDVAGAAAGGVRTATVAAGGRLTGTGEVRGTVGGVVVNDGTITAPVDLAPLSVTHNNFRVSYLDAVPMQTPTHVFAPTLAAAGVATPQVPGVAGWWSLTGSRFVDSTTPLDAVGSVGPDAAGTSEVIVSSADGEAALELPTVAGVGEPIAPTLVRRVPGGPTIATDPAVYTVTGPAGDVTTQVVSGEVLTFAEPGDYTVTATSAAPGFTHFSASAAIEVRSVPAFGADAPFAAVSGVPHGFTPPVAGSPVPTLEVSGGALPPGLELDGAAIAGTPTQAGEFTVELTARNPQGTAVREYTFTVAPGAPTALGLSIPAGVEARQGGSVTFEVTGIDAYGQPTDVAGRITLTSDVPTDVVDGLTVTFPHASPHVITATLDGNPLVTATLLVEVRPAATGGLAGTGADIAAMPWALTLALLGLGVLLVVRRRRSRVAS